MANKAIALHFSKNELEAVMFAVDRFTIRSYETSRRREAARSAFLKMMDAAPKELGYDGAVVPLVRNREFVELVKDRHGNTVERHYVDGKRTRPADFEEGTRG